MAVWMEIRCENRSNPSSNVSGPDYQRCESHHNHGPMQLACDTRTSVLDTLRAMETQAREKGWKKTKYGWICPYCAKQPNTLSELAAEMDKTAT